MCACAPPPGVSPLLVLYAALFLAEEDELMTLATVRGFVAGGVGFQASSATARSARPQLASV